jgi:hypothetical protein
VTARKYFRQRPEPLCPVISWFVASRAWENSFGHLRHLCARRTTSSLPPRVLGKLFLQDGGRANIFVVLMKFSCRMYSENDPKVLIPRNCAFMS